MNFETTDKSLKSKAISIKGKDYVLVADRIIYFNEKYPTGSVTTEIVRYESKQVIIKATIKPEVDSSRIFTGYSQAIEGEGFINKTSALENAETSAVGRALAMMGIGVIDSIASVDEIKKAENTAKIIDKKVEEVAISTSVQKLKDELKKLGFETTGGAISYLNEKTGSKYTTLELSESSAQVALADLIQSRNKNK